MIERLRRLIAKIDRSWFAALGITVTMLAPLFLAALVRRVTRLVLPKRRGRALRLLWAGAPLLSLKYASEAMAAAGYRSRTIANAVYPTINRADFDTQLELRRRLPTGLNAIVYSAHASLVFARELFLSDVLHTFFNGAILGRTPLARFEFGLWKLAGGRLVLMPYGSDAFVYARLPNSLWADALMTSYPRTREEDEAVQRKVEHGCRLADGVVGCLVHDVCLPRVDFHPLIWYPADTRLEPTYPNPGKSITIAHAANHPLVKGTNHLIDAVAELRAEGRNVELVLMQNASHAAVLEAFRSADIVVDQLLFGYALAALEGMALGKPVLTGLDDDRIYDGYRARGQLAGLPLIPAGPKTIGHVLRHLIDNPQNLGDMGRASRVFVERVHGPSATVELYTGVYGTFR